MIVRWIVGCLEREWLPTPPCLWWRSDPSRCASPHAGFSPYSVPSQCPILVAVSLGYCLAAMNNQQEQGAAEAFTKPSHEEVSRRAEDLWREYGSPEGRDEEIWLEAERRLLGERISKQANPAQLPSSGNFGAPQYAGTTQPERSDPTSQKSELMKEPATTTAARSKAKKSGHRTG